jgi:hypothetical protein
LVVGNGPRIVAAREETVTFSQVEVRGLTLWDVFPNLLQDRVGHMTGLKLLHDVESSREADTALLY